ncbi:myelin-associated glycoprotein-like [Eucyclogobius newberryi]|uniref:myelin-associated glycoprotein-like n=1 Tax=Eucyclogobius newberryi TaxID=166745 RepID=UPI003B58C026
METHVTLHMSWIALIIFLSGVLAADWSVNVPSQICTVTGSSVVLPCTYNFPESKDGHQVEVKSAMWCLGNERCITPRYVYHSAGILLEPSFQSRVEYLGNLGSKNCSVKISALQESDSGTYVFYLITNHTTEKMPAQRGTQLLVSGSPAAVSVLAGPSSVIAEGESVSLSCCSPGPSSEVLWFKTPSSAPKHNGSEWTISKTTHEDSGIYYCRVQTKEQVRKSKGLVLNVQYAPRNTVISASSSVTLTCSSDANPPVLTYTWYTGAACDSRADTSFYKSIQSYVPATVGGLTLSRINISSDPSEEHCCVARNRHGSQKSSVVSTSSETSNSGDRKVLIIVTIAVLLAIIAIIAFVMTRRKKSSRNQSYALAATSAET